RPHGVDFGPSDIEFGRGIRVREGRDVTLAVIGTQLASALAAADQLASSGISAEVLYFHTLKPFDADLLRASVSKTRRFVTVEELSAHDGLYNLCLRASVGLNGISAAQIAIEDFIQGYGTYDELCARVGLSPWGICQTVRQLARHAA